MRPAPLALSIEPATPASPAGLSTSSQVAPSRTLPVLRPKLPSAAQLAPYLHLIDESRCYSNGGPLSLRLQSELARHLGCPEDNILAATSATAAITASLLALDLPEGAVCLMPSWTFAATAQAALSAGMKPWFLDVEKRTWALNATTVKQQLSRSAFKARAIIVVSPFGAPIDGQAWETFQRETGITVIVDAAAGFDTVRFSSLLSVVSLHATKILGAGEGGFIVAPTPQLRNRIRSCSNFGFDGTRIAQRRAINSKLSEYHAAVALASLDCWPQTRLRHLQLAAWYRHALSNVAGVSLQPAYGHGWACSTTNVLLESDAADSILQHMGRAGIETRLWWGPGCHAQPAFAECVRENMDVTEYLGARVLGLPHFCDMEKNDVAFVVQTLSKALKNRARGSRRA